MIILIGVAGAGKSLQGKMITDDLGCERIATGDLFRNALTSKDGRLVSGSLISDEETIDLIDKALREMDVNGEFVLDGFPRTLDQAKWLISEIQKKRVHLTLIINLKASEEVVMERLLKRGREDDTQEVILRRFEIFKMKTAPIIDLYKKANLRVVDIDADGTPEQIHDVIMKHLKEAEKDVHESKD